MGSVDRSGLLSVPNRTTVIFIGLPYTGKTTLIQRLQEEYPGEALYADEIFTRTVSPDEVSLNRWLKEGPYLIERIQSLVQSSDETRFYVELGIMQTEPRGHFIRWAEAKNCRVIPLWLRCDNFEELRKRQEERVQEIGNGGRRGAKIDIELDELYQKICAAFEEPTVDEGFIVIDTDNRIEKCLNIVHQML